MSRAQRIDAYRSGASRIRRAWESVPPEARRFRPAPDEWSPHEIVIHLADADVNGYLRFRKLVAEPGGTVTGYAEADWARALDYAGQDPAQALALMDVLRSLTHPILAGLPDAAWEHTVTHSERGTWTMDDWLSTYTDHVDAHLDQMAEALAVWEATRDGDGSPPSVR